MAGIRSVPFASIHYVKRIDQDQTKEQEGSAVPLELGASDPANQR